MVLSDNGCYHTVTVREAATMAGGWNNIIDMQHSDFPDTTQHYRPQDPRRLSGVALQGHVVYYTANALDNCEGTMQVGCISSVRGPGQYEVTWDFQVSCLFSMFTTASTRFLGLFINSHLVTTRPEPNLCSTHHHLSRMLLFRRCSLYKIFNKW